MVKHVDTLQAGLYFCTARKARHASSVVLLAGKSAEGSTQSLPQLSTLVHAAPSYSTRLSEATTTPNRPLSTPRAPDTREQVGDIAKAATVFDLSSVWGRDLAKSAVLG